MDAPVLLLITTAGTRDAFTSSTERTVRVTSMTEAG